MDLMIGNDRAVTHGQSRTRTYCVWSGMVQRCTLETSHHWARYGGRGIRVCDRWRSFENFLTDMGEKPPGKTIEREDNDGDYEPGNCRWATPSEQARNRSNNRRIAIGGEVRTFVEWCEHHGLSKSEWSRAIHRLNRGMDPERAFTMPSSRR